MGESYTSHDGSGASGPDLATVILGAPRGSILAVDGIDLAGLRAVFEAHEPDPAGNRLLFLQLPQAKTASSLVDGFIAHLADVALKLWPFWIDGEPMPRAGTDALGRMAIAAAARRMARRVDGMLLPWAEAAALLALEGRTPRVPGTAQATELAQLARLIGPHGLTLLTEIPPGGDAGSAAAAVHALEWVARHMEGAVVVTFVAPPAPGTPFDRIRFGVHRAIGIDAAGPGEVAADATAGPPADPWLLPWRGAPHPLSAIEQRMARLLSQDAELGPLFHFNQMVETARGSSPKVDLLWPAGRLVVELDGYVDHGTRAAFLRDRHRDFELTLSGYTVLRLPNEEIEQDCWLALEKIRDLVRLRRQVLQWETERG